MKFQKQVLKLKNNKPDITVKIVGRKANFRMNIILSSRVPSSANLCGASSYYLCVGREIDATADILANKMSGF